MLKVDSALSSFEERKKAAPKIEFLVNKAISSAVFRPENYFQHNNEDNANDNNDNRNLFNDSINFFSASFKERTKKKLTTPQYHNKDKDGHSSLVAMTNIQNELIKDYIHQIIDIKHKEGLQAEEMEDKIYNSRISCKDEQHERSSSSQSFVLNKRMSLFKLKHHSDYYLPIKKRKKNRFLAKTDILPNYIKINYHGIADSFRKNNNNNEELTPCGNEDKEKGYKKSLSVNKLNLLNGLNDSKPINSPIQIISNQESNINNNNNNAVNNIIETSTPFIITNTNLLTKIQSPAPQSNTYLNHNNTNKRQSLSNNNPMFKQTTIKEQLIKHWKEEHYRLLHKDHYKVYDSCSDNEDEVDNPNWIFHPESIVNRIRHIVLTSILLYIIIFTPINVAFFPSFSYWFFTCDLISDISFFIDFFIPFFKPYPLNELEIYVFSHKEIVVNYLTSWALVDFITLLPFNIISIMLNYYHRNGNAYIELLRLIKIMKCVKQAFHSDTINKVKVGKTFGGKTLSPMTRLVLFAFLFLAFSHIFACIWTFLGTLSNPNWIIKNNLQDEANIDIYFAALYHIFATIFTVGYGDIVPVSLYERYYNIILQSVGLFLYSFVISSIMNIVKKSSNSIQLEEKLSILNNIRIQYSMSIRLFNKIFNVLKNDRQLSRKEQFNLINDFPLHIRNEMIQNMYKDLVQFKLFKNTNYDFISRVIMNLKEMTCTKGEVLIKEKSYVDELILVKRGRLSIECLYLGKLIKISQILKGEHFGDVNMILNTKCLFDIVVKTKVSQIYLLQKSVLIEIVSDSTDVFQEKEQKAIINMNLFKAKLKRKKRQVEEWYESNPASQLNSNSKGSHDGKESNNNNNNNALDIIPELVEGEENADTIISKESSNRLRSFNAQKKSNVSLHQNNNIKCTKSSKPHLSYVDVPNVNVKRDDSLLILEGRKSSAMTCKSLVTLKKKKTNSIRRDTMLLEQNIKSGSMNIYQPKVFYSSLFLKLNLDNQINHIKKIFKKIKKQYSTNILSVIHK